MKKLLLIGSLAAACVLATHDLSAAHGGTYRGPGGDTVPPTSGGGSSGGSTGSTPGGGSSGGSSQPQSSGPSSGGSGNNKGSGAAGPKGPSGPDPTQWDQWWGYNKDSYINLRGHLFSGSALPSPEDYFLAHGGKARALIGIRPADKLVRDKIVPALLEVLATENHNDIVTGAMIALAKIGDAPGSSQESELAKVFLPFLNNSSQEIAETAAVALGVLGDARSVSTLTSLLLDEEAGRKLVGHSQGVPTRTRAFAAFGLGQIGFYSDDSKQRQEIVRALWQICDSPRQSTRDLKIAAITAMGLVPLPAPLPGEQSQLDSGACPTDRQSQVLYLRDYFVSQNDANRPYLTRAHAPRAMCSLLLGYKDKALKHEVVKALAPYVTKRGSVGTREVRQSASQAFGLLGDLDSDPEDAEIRERLVDASKNSDPQVKNFSVMALGQIGGRPGDGPSAIAAIEPLRKFLREELVEGATQLRPWAGLAIGVMEGALLDQGIQQSNGQLAALRGALEDSRAEIEVGAYSIACGIARDADAEKILLEKFNSMSGDTVRGYSAVGLGLMNSTAAMDPLQETVRTSKYRMVLLKESAIALGILRDKSVVHELLQMLAEAKTLSSQASIASALGFIGDASSVDPLVQMLRDKDVTAAARGFAAVSLGIVADKEHLPWNAKFSVNINYRAGVPTLSDSAGKGLLDIL